MAKNPNPDQTAGGVSQATTSLRCAEVEPLFTGYLDGTLDAATVRRLDAHLVTCPECAAELKLVRQGKDWLQLLRADDTAASAPRGLTEKILAHVHTQTSGTAQTGPESSTASAGSPSAGAVTPSNPVPPTRSTPWSSVNLAAVRGNLARTGMRQGGLLDPRMMLTAAMAFFSISITMNVAGVRLGDLRPSNLKHTVTRTYSDTNAHVQHYYENMRVVYQLESRVRELRRAAEASDAAVRTARPQQQHRKAATGNLPTTSAPASGPTGVQTTPQSNTSRPMASDGVARRDDGKGGDGHPQKKSQQDDDSAPPVTGDLLEAALNFQRNSPSRPLVERFSAEPQRSDA